MYFHEVVLKNLLRRRVRSALTVLGLSVAVAATVSLLSIAWHFADSTANHYRQQGVDVVVVRAGVAERINSSLRVSLADEIRTVAGVAAIDYKLTEMVSLGEGSLIGIPLHGFDPAGFSLAQLTIASGRTLNSDDRRVVLVGASLANSLGKACGDELEIEGKAFQVVGLFQGADALDANTVIAPLGDVQQLMDRPNQVSEFAVRAQPEFANEDALRKVCRQVEALRDGEQRSFGFKAFVTRDFVSSNTENRLAMAMAWGTTALVTILSVIGMCNTMLMSILERTRELGVLRAIGWRRSRIVRLIVGESLVLGVVGVIAGCGGACLIVRVLSVWSATRTLVSPDVSPTAAVWGAGMGLIASMVGSFYPALRGASIPAVEALRYE